MYAIAAVFAAFLLPIFLVMRGTGRLSAWTTSCFVVPLAVLAAEFLVPYAGGGASMWPVALVVGGFWGAVAGALGTLVATRLPRNDRDDV